MYVIFFFLFNTIYKENTDRTTHLVQTVRARSLGSFAVFFSSNRSTRFIALFLNVIAPTKRRLIAGGSLTPTVAFTRSPTHRIRGPRDRLYRNTLSPLSVYACPLKRARAKCRFANIPPSALKLRGKSRGHVSELKVLARFKI